MVRFRPIPLNIPTKLEPLRIQTFTPPELSLPPFTRALARRIIRWVWLDVLRPVLVRSDVPRELVDALDRLVMGVMDQV